MLGGVVAAGSAVVVAFLFYGGAGALAWPLAVLVLYLGGMFALYQLVLWPVALRDPERPLRRRLATRLRRSPGGRSRRSGSGWRCSPSTSPASSSASSRS